MASMRQPSKAGSVSGPSSGALADRKMIGACANVPFNKELGNQGIKATDIPVCAFSVGEEELAGMDTNPLVGHLAAWNYFESVPTKPNKAFIKACYTYTNKPKRTTNDPMERITSASTCGCGP